MQISRYSKSKQYITRRTYATKDKPSTGILMLNLGGPPTLDEVEPFLTRLLSDKEIIKIPFQKYLGKWIAKRRAMKVKEQYRLIGGGSPILKHTKEQGELMCQSLNEKAGKNLFKYYVGFRYAAPLTEHAIEQIKNDGINRLIVFTQYPQYSCSTTGSSLNELYRQIQKHGLEGVDVSIIDRWPTDPGLVSTFADLVVDSLNKDFTDEEREDVVLLFSAHSLPMSVVSRGDTYVMEVSSTVHAVNAELKKRGYRNHYRLVWQSKVGPAAWMRPKTDEVIEGYGKRGRTNQLLIPIAFTSDHIETLYEYDIQYMKLAEEKGINLKRASSLNSHPSFIKTLCSVVDQHLSDPRSSSQYSETCPTCVNPDCKKAREFFLPLELKN